MMRQDPTIYNCEAWGRSTSEIVCEALEMQISPTVRRALQCKGKPMVQTLHDADQWLGAGRKWKLLKPRLYTGPNYRQHEIILSPPLSLKS